tara:strand:+ start:109 stop:822 length:714 start_codon:yes stop_codon:yes gene_type:complete
MGLIKIKTNFNGRKENVSLDNDKLELNLIKQQVIEYYNLKNTPDDIFLSTNEGFLLSNKTIHKAIDKNLDYEFNVNIKLKGGIIDAIFNMLEGIIKLIGSLYKILEVFINMFTSVLEMLPQLFNPPKLIDDILFAITSSITLVFRKFSGDAGNVFTSPEEDDAESGPLGVSNENRNAYSCMDPSWSTIMLLIICPPLAIIYKLGFWAGFISSIICGVLCVKLYYFPGLLFAILHVLC